MVKKKKLTGSNKLIVRAIQKGIPEDLIRSFYNLTETEYNFVYYQVINNLLWKKAKSLEDIKYHEPGFGFKDEAYYTEEEMIQGIPNYTWKDLPRNEKEFYYKYNHEMKSDWTQEEVKTVENYYHASDHELKSDTWLYVKEMIDQSGLNFPKRTLSAYRSKMQKVWRNKKEIKKFQTNN